MAEPIDARGLSCPQPVMLTRRAIKDETGDEVVILVDSVTQLENCTRTAERLGWRVSYDEKGTGYELTLKK